MAEEKSTEGATDESQEKVATSPELDEFFGDTPPEVETETETEEVSSEKTPETEEVKEEAKTEETEEVEEEKSEEEVKKASEESEKESTDEEKKDDTSKEDEKSVIQVELEGKLATTEKRRADSAKWGNGLSQENAALKKYAVILERKLQDPEYDPATDQDLIAREQAASDDVATQRGRAEASLQSAYGKYGEAETKELLTEYRQLYGTDRETQERVLKSDQPVQAAIDMMKLAKFFETYGDDTDKIVDTIRDKTIKELTPKIREEERKKLLAGVKKKNSASGGISKVRASTVKGKEKTEAAGGDDLDTLFGT